MTSTRSLLALGLSAAALGACGDQTQPTALKQPAADRTVSVSPQLAPALSIQLVPDVTSFGIDDPGIVSFVKVIITNNGSNVSGATVLTSMTQGPTSHHLAAISTGCPGALAGVIPHGTCQFTTFVRALNSDAGNGVLIPGPGAIRVDVTAGGATFTQTTPVTLTVGFKSVVTSGNWTLNGKSTLITATVTNTGGLALTNLSYQVVATQGSSIRASRTIANFPLLCDVITSPPGTLPNLSQCLMKIPSVMTNSAPGFGQIAPGVVNIELALMQGSTVVVRKDLIGTARDIRFTSVTVSDSASVIDGSAHAFKATIASNTPAPLPTRIVGRIRQGSAERGTIVGQLSCGSGAPDTLRTGTCTVTGTYAASNTAAGAGTLVSGAATLDLFLRTNFATSDTLATTSVPIALVSANATSIPTIGTVNVLGTPIIGTPGPNVPLTVQLANTGAASANTTVRIQVQQGAAARDAGGGTLPLNCGAGAGVIPAHGCTLNTHFAVSNVSSGSGTFVPGAATLGIIITDPVAGTIRKFVTITLPAK